MYAHPHQDPLIPSTSTPRVLLLCEPGEASLAAAISDYLAGPSGRTEIISFTDTPVRRNFSHVVAILPRVSPQAEDTRDTVAHMVDRLHKIAALAGNGVLAIVQFGGGRFGAGPEVPAPESCC